MNKVIRGVLGIVASLPAAYIAFFMSGWFCTLVVLFFFEGPPFGYFYYHRMVLWRLFLTSLITAAVLILAAIIHVVVANRLDAEAKGGWLLTLFIGNIVTLPLYWYLNIWRETPFHLAGAAPTIVDASGGDEAR